MRIPGMVVTDLDGTLSHASGEYTPQNLETLKRLGRQGFLRVVATGRSLFHARRNMPPDFPIDYLVFSSGAGILNWKTQELLVAHHLQAGQVEVIQKFLLGRSLDFMRHDPIPDNHLYSYWESGRENLDFRHRRDRQAGFCRPWTDATPLTEATQFLVIVGRERAEVLHPEMKKSLEGFSVIRATSPLDDESAWLEIFPKVVSKSLGATWIADRHGLATSQVLAIGNDYNDWDLLAWAGTSNVVSNAPAVLRSAFPVVASHLDSGFSEAVSKWLKKMGLRGA